MNDPVQSENRNWTVFARGVKTARLLKGWSLRELARRSSLTLKTVERAERGVPCRLATERKISEAIDIPLGRLWDADVIADSPIRTVTSSQGRWYFQDSVEAEAHHKRFARVPGDEEELRFRLDPDSIQDEGGRLRIGRLGLSQAFKKIQSGVIDPGQYMLFVCEIFKQTRSYALPGDVFMMYVLRGTLRFVSQGRSFTLSEGGSITYEASDDLLIEPVEQLCPAYVPPLLLITRLSILPIKSRKYRRK